jgi:hypothetical protein
MRGLDLLRIRADNVKVARGTPLRHLRPRRFRRSRTRADVEELTLLIAGLVAERQGLRGRGAGTAALERNRLRLARAQWELGHALIERHLPRPATRSAA